ncbi:hypothetical protein E2562_007653 [Oryza meyeriana var. granulata]|uniref:Uncharacterized protein n=1 Tax=Oryza meyeriana var. granulata TaxID=110450 RepID=A0A6G1DVC7_9ORYZ|nr:hypothetical protein E2562_007653 [Oryza meyeriana var. granulata]
MATLLLSSKNAPCSSPLLLVLLLLVVVFARQSSCSRPLSLPTPPTPRAMPSTANQPQLPYQEAAAESVEEEQVVMQQLSWLKSMKPRGRPQPSAPSMRTN